MKAVSAGIVGTGLPSSVAFAEETEKHSALPLLEKQRSHESLVDYVNIFQGTESTRLFSRGNTLPIVALPFGMAHWTLQSSEQEPWFFNLKDRRILGIRCTHQLSPWLGDYGQATFLPFQGETDNNSATRSASYRPEKSKILPHSLSLRIERYRAQLDLVPTLRGAILKVNFESLEGNEAYLAVDLPGEASNATYDKAAGLIHCISTATSGGTPPNFKTFYTLRVDSASEDVLSGLEIRKSERGCSALIRYRAEADRSINIRIGTSFISAEQSTRNLSEEIGKQSAEILRESAKSTWENHLGRAIVTGGTEEQRRIFYSGMYRALLFPRTFHEIDAAGKTIHYSPYSGKVEPGVLYADHGYWDVYRAWYPLMSVLFQQRLGEILQGWINAAHEGGWLPQFPAPGYRACMTGSLIDSIFGDAAAKGIQGFDVAAAYSALKKHATMPGDPDHGYGRRGIEDYLRLGYAPADRVSQSVAETVDSAYGDFCIAQVAKATGNHADAAMFESRSKNWQHLYDPGVHFLRGKKEDGKWLSPFDAVRWGDPYVEGSAWQHRWDVPHDPEGLIGMMGGAPFVADQLEKMCTMRPLFDVGSYKEEIHEISEMAAVDFGQYAHSNQPVHHVLYLFALAGRADRTQFWVRKVMNELYSSTAFAGDEDTGSMSAWFILSACGFYPFCPGKPEYVLGSPLFDRVVLSPEVGASLTIAAKDNSPENVFVRNVRINGVEYSLTTISHTLLAQGGTLEFSMARTPSTRSF